MEECQHADISSHVGHKELESIRRDFRDLSRRMDDLAATVSRLTELVPCSAAEKLTGSQGEICSTDGSLTSVDFLLLIPMLIKNKSCRRKRKALDS